jgi:hypothetical protein
MMNPNLEKGEAPTSRDARYANNMLLDQINTQLNKRSTQIEEVETVAVLAVDVANRNAVKGDDSDGRVDWTVKQIFATICLAGLYVGSFSILFPLTMQKTC